MSNLSKSLTLPEGLDLRLSMRKGPDDLQELFKIYEGRMLHYFEHMEPFLSNIEFKSVLDIGSGLAGIDALIANAFGIKEFHLMDGSSLGEKLNKYNDFVPEAWDDVARGEQFMRANVSDDVVIKTYHANADLTIPVDLIISLKSWAHHYPAYAYMDLAKRSLNPGGYIIVDIRNKTRGVEDFLEAGFKQHSIIDENANKCKRYVFTR